MTQIEIENLKHELKTAKAKHSTLDKKYKECSDKYTENEKLAWTAHLEYKKLVIASHYLDKEIDAVIAEDKIQRQIIQNLEKRLK